MDEDQREVRLIQEMLLEDGELHSEGPGRERKFRWKDIGWFNDLISIWRIFYLFVVCAIFRHEIRFEWFKSRRWRTGS